MNSRFIFLLGCIALFAFVLMLLNSQREDVVYPHQFQPQSVYSQQEEIKMELKLLRNKIEKFMENPNPNVKATNQEFSFKEKILMEKLEAYTVLHGKIVRGEMEPRFLKMPLINGWGNIFQEAVSAMLFALVTQRAIIFDISPLSYLPFREFLEDPPFDAYNLDVLRKYSVHTIEKVEIACMDFKEIESIPVISFGNVYDWFAPNVLVNPYHGDEVLKWLPKTYFKHIFNYLWKPKKSISEEVTAFKERFFGKYTIGIQIRHPTFTKDGKQDHKGFPVPPVELFAETAERLAHYQEQVFYDEVVWFLATQQKPIIAYLQSFYGDKKVVAYNGTIRTTFERDFEGQKSALITWFLLSETDDVLTTEASSYGTTAASLAGIDPIVCNHHKFCQRKLSPTPCQDLPWLTLNDPNSMDSQPLKCLLEKRKFPHHFLTAEDASCGHHKLQIYTSPEFQKHQNS